MAQVEETEPPAPKPQLSRKKARAKEFWAQTKAKKAAAKLRARESSNSLYPSTESTPDPEVSFPLHPSISPD